MYTRSKFLGRVRLSRNSDAAPKAERLFTIHTISHRSSTWRLADASTQSQVHTLCPKPMP